MFDISWSEFLLIGVVALVVIGPKELPAVMRTLGQWTRKLRSMALDFQNQFQEAMREAEMSDLKKQVDDLAQDVKNYDPLKDVRGDIESVGAEVKQSLTEPSEPTPALPAAGGEPALAEAPAETPAKAVQAAPLPASSEIVPAPPDVASEQSAREIEPVGAETATIDKAAETDGTGRGG